MGHSRSQRHHQAELTVLLVVWLPMFSGGRAVYADEQVVVLRNGNVLKGDVTRQAPYIFVDSGRSHIRLVGADIETVAPNLTIAYRRKSAQTAEHDTASRCQLIRWCVRHGLQREAAAEIEWLQKHHPTHPQLDQLRRLARTHRPDWKQTALPLPAPLHPDRAHVTKVRKQLSNTTIAQFVRVVQPLLVNRCGQANCHGTATDTSYQLVSSPWSKAPRGTTERNLGATLQRIGTTPPPETVLWMSATSPHGPLNSSPLDQAELRVLLDWIEQVSAELTGQPSRHDPETHQVPRAAAHPGDALENDPFDPDVFNAAAANTSTPQVADPAPQP